MKTETRFGRVLRHGRTPASRCDLRTGATPSYSFNPRGTVTLGLSTTTLLGDAADGPLVQKKTSVTGLLIAT